MDIQALLAEFLENLASITDEELFKELEKARDDSKDSYLLDGEDEILGTITDNVERSQVITVDYPRIALSIKPLYEDVKYLTDPMSLPFHPLSRIVTYISYGSMKKE